MDFAPQIADRLAALDRWAYYPSGPSAAEPAAWTCLALARHGRVQDAAKSARWLAAIQQPNGAVGITAKQATPAWPTSLALLAWNAVRSQLPPDESKSFAEPIERAVRWSLANHGSPAPRKPHIGHDTTIVGWSWAADTHSWLEPTCLFVMALQANGERQHARVRDGLKLIVDRLLPSGGCNYGNTIVLGQPLLPHMQPTGLAMMALADEATQDDRIGKSLDYLALALQPEKETTPAIPTASLCYGLMGLAAHGRRPREATTWLKSAYARESHKKPSALKLALLALAASDPCPWLAANQIMASGGRKPADGAADEVP